MIVLKRTKDLLRTFRLVKGDPNEDLNNSSNVLHYVGFSIIWLSAIVFGLFYLFENFTNVGKATDCICSNSAFVIVLSYFWFLIASRKELNRMLKNLQKVVDESMIRFGGLHQANQSENFMLLLRRNGTRHNRIVWKRRQMDTFLWEVQHSVHDLQWPGLCFISLFHGIVRLRSWPDRIRRFVPCIESQVSGISPAIGTRSKLMLDSFPDSRSTLSRHSRCTLRSWPINWSPTCTARLLSAPSRRCFSASACIFWHSLLIWVASPMNWTIFGVELTSTPSTLPLEFKWNTDWRAWSSSTVRSSSKASVSFQSSFLSIRRFSLTQDFAQCFSGGLFMVTMVGILALCSSMFQLAGVCVAVEVDRRP